MSENPFFRHFPETSRHFADALPRTPKELYRDYSNGELVGAITADGENLPWFARDAARWEVDSFAAESECAVYEETKHFGADRFAGDDENDFYHPWKTYLFEDPTKAMQGRQRTGDCTSWMVRLMVQLARLERMKAGHQELYKERTATCAYYADRGHTGQGSNPTRQCRNAAKVGHVFEIEYGRYDLRNYDSYYKLGMSWGRSGVPKEITDITSKYSVGQPHQIKSVDGVLDAFRKRYAIGMGSSLGATAAGNPMSKVSGSWNHAMGWAGYDNRPSIRDSLGLKSAAVFIDQSWGNWSKVSNLPESWKPWPQGMFALELNDLKRYIERGECLCFVPDESTGVPAEQSHPFLTPAG
jgi:hypothetical protein